ncbi:MAG: hypothetical protein JWP74_3675 [Marmoricola sp.]|nr:hypothetical protein [Marmoricola sp.]
MTSDELGVLMSFLCSGVLLGILAAWIDQVVTYTRKR